MALKLTTSTQQGFTATDAYHRVEKIVLIGKHELSGTLRSYANLESVAFNESVISAPYDMNGANPFKQFYEHLKRLPAFAGATDC